MFTGIIEGKAIVDSISKFGSGLQFWVKISSSKNFSDVIIGESIAVNGVCLTVEEVKSEINVLIVRFFASIETINKTNISNFEQGTTSVNLERAIPIAGRLSGHIVQGHIDGVGRLKSIDDCNGSKALTIELPTDLLRYVIVKGSVTLDGISLTVNTIENNLITVMIIPHTWSETNLSSLAVGHDFNVEVDVIAKYVERLTLCQRSN